MFHGGIDKPDPRLRVSVVERDELAEPLDRAALNEEAGELPAQLTVDQPRSAVGISDC
jgi:hypothetical protein